MASNATFPGRMESRPDDRNEANSSGVSWAAVFGGALVGAASFLILIALGAGMGLSAISPWSNEGVSASTMGTAAIVWLILMEMIASALGGWLTGRLRTKWAVIHTDEVFFRDTANGFLAWAVALVIGVSLLTSAATSMAGGVAAGRMLTGSSVVPAADPNGYYIDTLFRSDRVSPESKDAAMQAETGRIFANALKQDQIPAADQSYLAQQVAVRTGIGMPEASKRVTDAVSNARVAADAARSVMARFLLWPFLALLVGAFSASYAATVGGRQRDHVKTV